LFSGYFLVNGGVLIIFLKEVIPCGKLGFRVLNPNLFYVSVVIFTLFSNEIEMEKQESDLTEIIRLVALGK
jgi:hypothetical protein